MKDINEVRLSGIIDRVRPIPTKSGGDMCEVVLRVKNDKFRVTGFGSVAKAILERAHEGDPLAIGGSLSTSSWRDKQSGEWRNSWSVTAWGIELHGEKVSYQRERQPSQTRREADIPTPPPDAYF
jgi:single-stranded DNA-binding protein